VLIALRSGALALLLAGKPAAAWAWSAPSLMAEGYGSIADAIVAALAPGAALVAVLHVWLACCPGVASRGAAASALSLR